jgi:hypothetical protein
MKTKTKTESTVKDLGKWVAGLILIFCVRSVPHLPCNATMQYVTEMFLNADTRTLLHRTQKSANPMDYILTTYFPQTCSVTYQKQKATKIINVAAGG